MSLSSGQASASTASTVLFPMPPGSAVVTINSATASTATAYLGFGSNAANTAAGYILDPGRSLTFASYTKSGGGNISAITASGAATLSWVISTSN